MKVLWIVFVWPEPDSSAAGYRTMQLLTALQAQGHVVEVCSPCRNNDYRKTLETLGFHTASFQPNDSAFDAYARSVDPQLVLFDRFITEEQFGWRVREQCPDAVRVLDTIDLHSLRRVRQRMVAEGRNPLEPTNQDLATPDGLRELAAIYRSDLSLIISDAELALLRARYGVPDELLTLCRMAYPAPKNLAGFDTRSNFAVIGNFHHEPNVDSVRLLRRSLWKNIRERLERRGCGGVELHVYGAYPTKELMALDNPREGFRMKGKAPNSFDTLAHCRVNLAPLRFGAGIKGKVADGWSVGTPCAGTRIAAEGMRESLPFGGVVADDLDEFAERAAALYCDRSVWENAQLRGSEIIRSLYSEQILVRLMTVLENAVRERDTRRQRNFVGQLLWHQGHRSTEFFSRWIEAKNAVATSPVLRAELS